ncbi:hypothetical protein KI387_005087, partial [Taxus chinensis]
MRNFSPKQSGTSGTKVHEPAGLAEISTRSTGTSETNGCKGAERAENQPDHDTCHKGKGQKVKG